VLISGLEIGIDKDTHDCCHVQQGGRSEWILNEPLDEVLKERHRSDVPMKRVRDSADDAVLCLLSGFATCACSCGVLWLLSIDLLAWTMQRKGAFSPKLYLA
jgi:hypothetical protein